MKRCSKSWLKPVRHHFNLSSVQQCAHSFSSLSTASLCLALLDIPVSCPQSTLKRHCPPNRIWLPLPTVGGKANQDSLLLRGSFLVSTSSGNSNGHRLLYVACMFLCCQKQKSLLRCWLEVKPTTHKTKNQNQNQTLWKTFSIFF